MARVLTEAAQSDRDDFIDAYGYRGGCTCFISPPCCHCTHPGNPSNQLDDECCWEWEDDLGMLRSGEIRKVCGKRARVLRRRGEHVWWSQGLHCLVWSRRAANVAR